MTHTPSRRSIIVGAGATAMALTPIKGPLFSTRARASTGQGAVMRDRITAFLAGLDEASRDAVLFDFNDRQRQGWNYMLGSRPAPGFRLEQMTDVQKDDALEILRSGLSDEGFETALNIMLQQDILRDEWNKGSRDRNRERFSLMVFGEPSATEPWAWRWEGHHLTITFTLVGDEIVSHTPKAFASEPNTVPSGPHKGLVVLPENEVLGRAIFAELEGAARRRAHFQERSVGNITLTAGREDRITGRAGLALGEMPQTSIDKVQRLIDLYTLDHLNGLISNPQRTRNEASDLSAVHFAFSGRNEPDESIYYRIHGDTFLIEFATLRNQPQHHHTIVHDLERNLGRHVI
ncbi:MAG: DUF3500 domain-containing protein [Pseudomonadota bacterium]